MKIVITGAAGFVGSQLAYSLYKDGHTNILIDDLSFGYRDNLTIDGESFGKFILDDIRNSNFEQYLDGADVVILFAAIAPLPVCQADPARAYSVNVTGMVNILEACRKKKVPKILFASTSAVYENNTTFPFKEEDIISPHLIYSMTKAHAEDIIQSFVKLYDMDITILRFFNLYGKHQDFRRKSPPLIGYLIKCMMLNEIPILHSDGLQQRDYVYIDDVCNICKLAIYSSQSKGETFNVASNSVISMNEIYNIISKLMTSNIKPILRNPVLLWDKYPELMDGFALDGKFIAKETNKFSQGSYDKARSMLGWEPKISFEDGIMETVQYAKKIGL